MRNAILGLLCLCLFGVAVGRAEELTVDQAKRLAQDRSGRLLLDGLTALSPEAAKELAKHDGWLSLNGLKGVSDAIAEALGQHKGQLHLDGLTNLSEKGAKSLARHYGELSLNGLTSLSDEAGAAFAKHSGGRLYLKGVKVLSTEVGKALAQRKGGGPSNKVCLDGVESLTVEAAEALAQTHGHNWDGRLPAMKTIPEDVARALAKRQGGLSLEGLTSLSSEAAKALGGKLVGHLPRLTSLTVGSAKAIAGPVPGQFHRTLNLDGLTALPDDIAVAIGGKDSRGNLYLNGLTSLTPIAAKAICQREGDLYLNGLTTISDETLKTLAEHKSPAYARPIVYLRGLTSLSDEGAAILAAWPKWSGELPALAKLSEKVALELASSRNWDGKLPAVQSLSPEAAKALAKRKGNLSLAGLTKLSDESTQALAEHQGGTLSLDGLTKLSEKSATTLARRKGRLSLNGLTTLSEGVAKALAAHEGDWLFLDGLATLSGDAAKALAAHTGVVALPDKVKPKATGNVAAADAKTARAFLDKHCVGCHNAELKEGDLAMDNLAQDEVSGRVAYASILERLVAGDMPPSSKRRPSAAETAPVIKWIRAKLDEPLKEAAAYYPVKEKPIDGNRLPHAILFGGKRGPSVPPPPRLWRVSPGAYTRWLGEFNANGLQQPFGLIQEPGFRDFSALYAPDEGATGLLLANAELLVNAQVRGHSLVNVVETPAATKEALWPSEGRMKTAAQAEREKLKKGVRVRQGNGLFAPLMHPDVRPNKDELEKAIRKQYETAVARQPSEEELKSVLALYDDVAGEGELPLAGKTILMAPLMTPEAILRFEVGLGKEVRKGVRILSPREAAFAISLSLSDKRDLGLLAEAARGKLTTREEVAEAVKGILDNPKMPTSRVLWFFREYFDYHRAPEVFKDPLPDYLQRRGIGHNPGGYVADTDFSILNILAHDKDVLKELLTTTTNYRSHELFRPDGPIFRHLPPFSRENQDRKTSGRIGILMQPSWQVAWSTNFHNDIVRRGRWVRERLLGGRVPDLPIDTQAMIPDDPHHTLRQRQMVTRAPACWKCHQKMDELGLPFEDVNHYGVPIRGEEVLDLEATEVARTKTKDNKAKIYRLAPLDTTGLIAFSGDPSIDGPVRDAPEMLRRLAGSERVRQVFIRHAFRYFLGRNETPGDAVTLQEVDAAYVKSGGSFKALLAALLASEAFLYRTVPASEQKR